MRDAVGLEESFTTKVQVAGINPYIDVPVDVVTALGGWFRTTLVPRQSEPSRLYLDTWMRETAGVGVGDRVCVTVKLDPDPRVIPLPGPLRELLERNPQAKAAWEALTPSRRREILSYLNFLKTPEALERNIQITIAKLLKK